MAAFLPSNALDAVVFEVGSTCTRAGFSGEENARVVCASAVGTYVDASGEEKRAIDLDHLCADVERRIKVRRLIHAHYEEREELVQRLLAHGFSALNANPKEFPVLLAEEAAASSVSRRRSAEMLFEGFGVPALCVARSAELAAIYAGRSSAVVVDMTAASSSAVVVADGVMQPRTLQTDKVGGAAIAQIFCKRIADGGINFDGMTRRAQGEGSRAALSQTLLSLRNDELMREVMESLGRVQPSRASSASSAAREARAPLEYLLPDGRVVSVGAEQATAPEAFFSELAGKHKPLQVLVLEAVKCAEPELHKDLLRNVVVCGDASCLLGLPERLEAELKFSAQLCAPTISSQVNRIAVHAAAAVVERKSSVWQGGSILASLGASHELWMSKREYEEHGGALISRKGLQSLQFM
eukprot:CAMPEP_0119355176 /NCGR_PEP_ID=MMETSP1334-20130426/4044_1 /TAXON_ID=127549 /ORGANISM="Calcidiscus leptoporus, Strain RCC1130" /LENGTH=411 /DNA_ID=CAMNT_0007368923 /DNA_START=13 /DNA_END=1248 /DNA_ORIENTATION=-